MSSNLSCSHLLSLLACKLESSSFSRHIFAPKLICDCSARWLRNWIRSHSFEKTVVGKCKTPLWLAGKSLFGVDDAEFVCGMFYICIMLSTSYRAVGIKHLCMYTHF